MASIQNQEDTILVKDLTGGLSFEEMQHLETLLKNDLKKGTSSLTIDLSGLTRVDYSAIAFIISCGETGKKAGRKIFLKNLNDPQLADILFKNGFDSDGQYNSRTKKSQKPASIFLTSGEVSIKIAGDIRKFFRFFRDAFTDIYYIARHPLKFDLKEVLFYMDKSGADAIPITTMICFLVGMILAFQGLAQLGKFGLDVYVADLVGLSIVRELGPLMVAMICIGRAGSAYAAELGTMKVAEELDAMNTMGLTPARFLVIPKIVALMTVMPMLTIIGDSAGIAGGALVSVGISDITIMAYCERTINSLIPANVLESVVKSIIFAFIIAGLGCFRGMEADNDAKGVGKAATSAVVSGIFFVIVADAIVTFIFPQFMKMFGVNY